MEESFFQLPFSNVTFCKQLLPPLLLYIILLEHHCLNSMTDFDLFHCWAQYLAFYYFGSMYVYTCTLLFSIYLCRCLFAKCLYNKQCGIVILLLCFQRLIYVIIVSFVLNTFVALQYWLKLFSSTIFTSCCVKCIMFRWIMLIQPFFFSTHYRIYCEFSCEKTYCQSSSIESFFLLPFGQGKLFCQG